MSSIVRACGDPYHLYPLQTVKVAPADRHQAVSNSFQLSDHFSVHLGGVGAEEALTSVKDRSHFFNRWRHASLMPQVASDSGQVSDFAVIL